MNIVKNCDSIRQPQPGQFRRPQDGKRPYAHVKGQKVDSKEEREKSSVYVNNKSVTTFKNGIGSDFSNLFDTDAGLKLTNKRLNGTNCEKKLDQQYDKTGKTSISAAKEDRLIDQWI